MCNSHTLANYWAHVVVDEANMIRFANDKAATLLAGQDVSGKSLKTVLTWLRLDWFADKPIHKVAKTSLVDRYLLDIIPHAEQTGWFNVFFRKVDDYDNPNHLWCEAADAIIGVQRFIDTSYDGMEVADGQGKVLAVNEAFLHICGLQREDIIGKTGKELVQEGLIPHSCTQHAIEQQDISSAVVKYPYGKEAVVTAAPLYDNMGRIVRVLSNVRDISELNMLHEKLKSAEALAHGFQRELKAMQAAKTDIHMRLARSRIMENLYELVRKVAGTDLQLMITGESGVGKTALAKMIHAISERSSTGNFIHVNCSAIPDALLESELFGYEEGAFTGAKKTRVGLFELANKGTIFLDEIGDMPLPLQAKILNVLQESKFYRVGGSREIHIDVRVVAATNMNLGQLIEKGMFRQDLYYRLNVIPVRIPPLRERKEDIRPLVAHYLEICNNRYRRTKTISPEVMEVFLDYHWPGNIREMMNLIEGLVVIVDEPNIELRHLPGELMKGSYTRNGSQVADSADEQDSLPGSLWKPNTHLKQLVEKLEGQIIEEAIGNCSSLKEAAKNLGVDVTTIIRKRKRSH
jgi:PAS domain S-box-containing protein